MENLIVLSLLLFCIASLYSSVGHAGASGYLAILSLTSFTPDLIKPISLGLNCCVALVASIQFIRLGFFDKRIFFIFTISSLPFAFLGGQIQLATPQYKLLAGVFLILSAVLLILKARLKQREIQPINIPMSLIIGSTIGFVSGLIGVGGGIFLSPILILLGWATVKNTAGISALFILFNSIAGLVGQASVINMMDSSVLYFTTAVVVGGFFGSYLGTKKLSSQWVTYFLVLVLFSAGIKFIWV